MLLGINDLIGRKNCQQDHFLIGMNIYFQKSNYPELSAQNMRSGSTCDRLSLPIHARSWDNREPRGPQLMLRELNKADISPRPARNQQI
jgi:hypothetical protein